ncbi:hypothetical protein DFJ73DRAFT_897223 [Zopfochytrium polystomum]|nr:hypothetical protein DFJ73DRAFT_897223 [Zopfochytrium polystomum]
MFKKPFTTKSQAAVRSSDRRKLRSEVLTTFPLVSEDALAPLLPGAATSAGAGKHPQPHHASSASSSSSSSSASSFSSSAPTELAAWSITTHAGDAATVYALDGQPTFLRLHDHPAPPPPRPIASFSSSSSSSSRGGGGGGNAKTSGSKSSTSAGAATAGAASADGALLLPTVYCLWRLHASTTVLPCVATNPHVLERLAGGADLMLPGVDRRRSAADWGPAGAAVAVWVRGVAVGVGVAVVSREDAERAAWAGRGVKMVHVLEDALWAAGDRSGPPPPLVEDGDADAAAVAAAAAATAGAGDGGGDGGNGEDGEYEIVGPGEGDEEASQVQLDDVRSLAPTETTDGNVIAELGVADEMASSSSTTPEAMDALLAQTFLSALKLSAPLADPKQFPITSSTFYSAHMLPYRAAAPGAPHQPQVLDVKHSSHKKLSKFLKAMEKKGYVKLKERAGDTLVVGVNWKHPEIVAFVPPPMPRKAAAAASAAFAAGDGPGGSGGAQSSASLSSSSAAAGSAAGGPRAVVKIVEMYRPNGSVSLLVEGLGIDKDAYFSASEIRSALDGYYKGNSLIDSGNPRLIKLDIALAHTILRKEERDVDYLARDAILTRVLEKMSPFYELTLPNQQPTIKKGHMKPITLTIENRMTRKSVTRIAGVEAYGIDPEELAGILKTLCASSTTLNAVVSGKATGSVKTHEVLVQGSKVPEVCRCLAERYGIPFGSDEKGGGGGSGSSASSSSSSAALFGVKGGKQSRFVVVIDKS